MTIYNDGCFCAKTMEDMEKLIRILNEETELFQDYLTEEDVIKNKYTNELQIYIEYGLMGNIENQLEDVAKKCKEEKLNATFGINYGGDYEGRYIFDGNEFASLTQEEAIIYDADDKEIIEEARRRGLTLKEKAPHNELWEVKGIDENENLTFAVCTSEELAKAAVETIANVTDAFDEDSLVVTKSNLHLNQVIIDNAEINLHAEDKKTYSIVGLQYSPDDYLTKEGMLRLMDMLSSDKFVTWDIDGNNATSTFLIAEDVAGKMSVSDMEEFSKYVENVLNDVRKETKTGEYIWGDTSDEKFWMGYL